MYRGRGMTEEKWIRERERQRIIVKRETCRTKRTGQGELDDTQRFYDIEI